MQGENQKHLDTAAQANCNSALLSEAEGNSCFEQGNYERALHYYNKAINLHPDMATVWVNKGLAHKKLEAYCEALYAFEKAFSLNKEYKKALVNKEDMIELINKKEPVDLPKEAEAFYRSEICKSEYLQELAKFELAFDNIKSKVFIDLLKLVNRLIIFIHKHYQDINNVHFLNNLLLVNSEEGAQQRRQAVGNKVFVSGRMRLNEIDTVFFEDIDKGFIQIIKVVKDDIFLEDAKNTLRMLFEVFYYFPREIRGKLIKKLPWSENSWYLFEFCCAIFTDDNMVYREKDKGGINLVSFDYNKDIGKQKQLAMFQYSLMQYTSIIKIAILDIVRQDIPILAKFFISLYDLCKKVKGFDDLTFLDEIEKMGKLDKLYAILWYSKQLFHLKILLTILPAVPGNSSECSNKAFEQYGIQSKSNQDEAIDFSRWFESQKERLKFGEEQLEGMFSLLEKMNPYCTAELREAPKNIQLSFLKEFHKIALSLIGDKPIKISELERSGFFKDSGESRKISYGLEPRLKTDEDEPLTKGHEASMTDFTVGPITAEKRMMLASSTDYFDTSLLKGRLGLVRKLQLIGEIFIPRNLGNKLKNVSYIDTTKLYNIRNGLTHIEDHHFSPIIQRLENNQNNILNQIFIETQRLKEQIYEEIYLFQRHFPEWPDSSKLNFNLRLSGWGPFVNTYWDKIKSFYKTGDFDFYIPRKSLITDSQCQKILTYTKTEYKTEVEGILNGNEAGIDTLRDDAFLRKYIVDSTDKRTKKIIKKLWQKAVKKYKRLRHEKNNAIEKENTRINREKKRAMSEAMRSRYPTLNYLAEEFRKLDDASLGNALLCDLLKDRLTTLVNLLNESKIEIRTEKKTKDALLDKLKGDVAFSLSTSYLLGQIIGLLNKLNKNYDLSQMLPEIDKNLAEYVAVRNAIEHVDPVFGSIELPYYQMESNMSYLIVNIVGDLIFIYYESILSMNPTMMNNHAKGERNRQQSPVIYFDFSKSKRYKKYTKYLRKNNLAGPNTAKFESSIPPISYFDLQHKQGSQKQSVKGIDIHSNHKKENPKTTTATSIKTLPDGNCAYNTVVFVLITLLNLNRVPNNASLKNLLSDIAKECSISNASVEIIAQRLNQLNQTEQQKKLAKVLRKHAVEYINKHYEDYRASYQEQLWAVYHRYPNARLDQSTCEDRERLRILTDFHSQLLTTNIGRQLSKKQEDELQSLEKQIQELRATTSDQIIDDTFTVHPHIRRQFATPQLSKQDLLNWWEREGKQEYFDNIKKPAKGAFETQRWGSEVEIAALACLLEINITWHKQGGAHQEGIKGGLISKEVFQTLTEQDRRLLINYGIADPYLNTMRINDFSNRAELLKACQALEQQMIDPLKSALNVCVRTRNPRFPEHIPGVNDMPSLIARLSRRHVITKTGEDYSFITEDGRIQYEEIVARITKPIPQDLMHMIETHYHDEVPEFHIRFSNGHWYYCGTSGTDNALSRKVSSNQEFYKKDKSKPNETSTLSRRQTRSPYAGLEPGFLNPKKQKKQTIKKKRAKKSDDLRGNNPKTKLTNSSKTSSVLFKNQDQQSNRSSVENVSANIDGSVHRTVSKIT